MAFADALDMIYTIKLDTQAILSQPILLSMMTDSYRYLMHWLNHRLRQKMLMIDI